MRVWKKWWNMGEGGGRREREREREERVDREGHNNRKGQRHEICSEISENLLLGPGELGTDLANANLAHGVASLNALGEGLAGDEGAHEATSERVTGAVGVDDLVVGKLLDGEDLGVLLASVKVGDGVRGLGGGDVGRVGTLGDDGETGARSVLLGEVGEDGGDRGRVGGLLIKDGGREYVS